MNFPAYKDVKPIKVDWLGEVPLHWEVKRLKYVANLLADKSDERENSIGLENIESWTGRYIETGAEFQGNGINFDAGDLLFGKLRPYLAKVWLAEFEGEAVGDFHVMRPSDESFGKFLVYQMLNRDFISIVDGSTFGAKMPRASWDFMANLPLPVPPEDEQKAISSFLDMETSKIDSLVSEQRRLIKLLKEKRQAVISHAVTKGLKPNAPMKPSGIEWLGDIPKHWEISQSRRLFSLRNERVREGDEQLTASQDYGVIPQKLFMELEDRKVVQVILNAEILKHVELGDFVISMRSFQGGIEYATHSGCISSAYVMLVPSDKIHGPFFKYLFKSITYIQALQSTTNLVRDGQALRFQNFTKVDLPLIPLDEQKQIALCLDRETSQIDDLIVESQRAIELLQERRTALISAAVTGKIDVRNYNKEKD